MDLDLVLSDLRHLTEAESYSDDLDGLRACASLLADLLDQRVGGRAEIGEDARVTWQPEAADGPGPPVLILGHLDTVWPPGTVTERPFRVRDGTVTGPGVFDMKGGLVVTVHALAGLRRAGRLPPVRLLVTTDEETGSRRSRPGIEAAARACGRVLVPEPCGRAGAVKYARKGVAMGTIVVRGRAAHAGVAPEAGINAGVALGALLPRVAALGDADTGTTVTPTLLRAGTSGNTVPDRAEAVLDVRFFTPGEVERVRRDLAALEPPGAATVSVELEINRPPLHPDASAPLLPALAAAARAAGLEVGTEATGGASDGNLAAAVGAAVLDGLGPEGADPHAETEHVLVDGLVRRVALLTELIPRVAAAPVPPA